MIFFATAAAPTLPMYMLAKAAIGLTTTIGTLASYPLVSVAPELACGDSLPNSGAPLNIRCHRPCSNRR